jgi:methionine aminopeptidase
MAFRTSTLYRIVDDIAPDILMISSRPLENGDIVNIDITVYLDGFHGDTSHTFLVGDVVSTIL